MNSVIYDQKMNAINSLFCCDDMRMRQNLFCSQGCYLRDVRFLFFNHDHSNIDASFNAIPLRIFEDEYEKFHLYGIGDYSKSFLIDCNHAIPGVSSCYYASKTVYLDLNILIDIYQLLTNKRTRIDVDKFKNYLRYLRNNKFKVDIHHAALERVATLNNKVDESEFRETIKYFYLFLQMENDDFNYDVNSLSANDNTIINNFVDERIAFDSTKLKPYCAICCLIEKAYLIKKDSHYKSSKQRVEALVEYALFDLSCNMENELYFLSLYLSNDQRVTSFFRKLDRKSDIIKNIRNTAWDMFQLRLLEEEFAINNFSDFNQVVFPYYATHDQGLSMIIEMNPVLGIALVDKRCIPLHKYRLQDIVKSYDKYVEKSGTPQVRAEKAGITDYEAIRNSLEECIITLNS